MRRLSFALAVSLASLTACYIFQPWQPQNLCENRVRAACHFAFGCCNPNERAKLGTAFGSQYASEGDCVDDNLKNNGACSEGYAIKESVDEGRFEYDEELATKCNQPLLDALNSCDSEKVFDSDKLDLDKDCEDVDGAAYGTGTVGDGDECFDPYECKDKGALCIIQQPDDPKKQNVTLVGECVSPHKKGQECQSKACFEDFDCDESDNLCEPDTACQTVNAGDPPECVELKDIGDDCFIASECKSDFCDPADGTCANPPVGDDIKLNVEMCNGNDADDTKDNF